MRNIIPFGCGCWYLGICLLLVWNSAPAFGWQATNCSKIIDEVMDKASRGVTLSAKARSQALACMYKELAKEPKWKKQQQRGVRIEVKNIGLRQLEGNAIFVEFSWKADVKSSEAETVKVCVWIELYDKNGFKLGESGTRVDLAAWGVGKVRRTGMIAPKLYRQTERYGVKARLNTPIDSCPP